MIQKSLSVVQKETAEGLMNPFALGGATRTGLEWAGVHRRCMGLQRVELTVGTASYRSRCADRCGIEDARLQGVGPRWGPRRQAVNAAVPQALNSTVRGS